MNKLHLLLPAAAMLLTGFVSSCNNDDDQPTNSNSIIEESDYEEGDTVTPKVIVMSFDKFADENTPEVTIANSDTTVLMVKKTFLERYNEAIDDTVALYISVWDKSTHAPFLTKVTDAEDAGDEVKVYVRSADITEVLGDSENEFSFVPYFNASVAARNSDGSFNTEFYVDPSDGIIHPVAIFTDETNTLKKSSGNDTVDVDYSGLYTGLIEDAASENWSFDPRIPISFSLAKDDVTALNIPISKGDWGKLYFSLGLNQLDVKLLLGMHFCLDTKTVWKKTSWWPHISYPSVGVKRFATGLYGEVAFNSDLGIDLKFDLEKGSSMPAGSTADDAVVTPPFKLDASKHTAKANETHSAKLIANELNNMKDAAKKNFYKWPLPTIPVWHGVFFVGVIPILVNLDLCSEFRFYPPKVNANLHFGVKCKYDRTFYEVSGYSDGSSDVELPTGDKFTMHDGWDVYYGSECKDKGLVIGADLTGSASTKFGLYFTTQVDIASTFSGAIGFGPAIEAKCAGAVTGWEKDLTSASNVVDGTGATSTSTLDAYFGACVKTGIDCVIDGSVNILDIIKLAQFNTSFYLYELPLAKYMVSTQTGLEYDGVLSEISGSDTKNISVVIDDKVTSKFEFLPKNDAFDDEFMASDKVKITLPAMEFNSISMPEVVFAGVERVMDGYSYKANVLSQKVDVDNHDVSYEISSLYVKNSGNLSDTKYYDLSFDLMVTIDNVDYKYSFVTKWSNTEKSLRVPYAY